MAKITIELEASMMLPILNMCVFFFNQKYPCTDESNDFSDMPIEDEVKHQIYDYLLFHYNKHPELYKREYKSILESLINTKQ